ncbi:MAG: ATP-binding protein [Pseudomonadota bacterium]
MSTLDASALPAAAQLLHAQLLTQCGERGVLCLSLDGRYAVRGWLGEPSRFGLGDLVTGMDVRAGAPYLDHFEDAGRLTLPFVNIGEHRAVHLHVLPDSADEGKPSDGWHVLFADADGELVRERDVQQRENEARARTQRLQGRLVEATAQGQLWRDQAEQARAATWRLAGMLSHELRTPLSAIAGYARLLEQALEGVPEQRDHARVISRSATHIAGLIEATLEQYRRDSAEVSVHPQPTDVRALVSHLTALLAPLAADKALGFAAFVSPDLPERLHLDGMRLRQMLLNLLGNAIKYTEEGGVRLDVHWEDEGHQLELAVADTGLGIPPELRERVFQPFDRAGREGQDGTGLGLHISRLIAQRMGGGISLDDTAPGEGSRFVIRIVADPIAMGAPAQVLDSEMDLNPGEVLVGEDDPDLAALFKIFLSRAGFKATFVSRASALVSAVAAQPPQLVLVDLNLEDGDDGLAAARRVRADGYEGAIIAMSATDVSVREDALAAGCDEFLVKPIPPEDLLALMFEVLRRRAAA